MQDLEDSKEKLDEIVKRATLNQFIAVRDLASIMAEEEGYSDILPHLWKFYQCDIDYKIITTVFDEISIDPVQTVVREIALNTFQDRCCAWRELLKRWVGIMFDERLKDNGITLDEFLKRKLMSWKRANLKPIPNLDVFQYYDKPDRLQTVDIFFRDYSDFIKLDDLKEYIKGIEQTLQIKFPLPKRLFVSVKDDTNEPASSDYETFIRSLRVWYESDSEIKIQVPGRAPQIYSCASFGFRNERAKGWRTLLEILQDPDHLYNIGPAHKDNKVRVRNYDAQIKRLDHINTKLCKFISRTYNQKMPKGFKLYELRKNEKPGTYGFKFQVGAKIDETHGGTRYDQYSKDNLLLEIKNLHERLETNPNNPVIREDFSNAMSAALERGFMTNEEVRAKIRSS